ncbi:MAG TPA: hypothetical protein DCS35_00970 [Vibrio sp.]|nr:hypothetical protein [Vibrio sp.]
MKKVLWLCFLSQPVLADSTCENFTALFEQRDFTRIESMFRRAAQELGYPHSSIYLNEYYGKTTQDQVLELRRVYRGCYSLKRKKERLVNLLR